MFNDVDPACRMHVPSGEVDGLTDLCLEPFHARAFATGKKRPLQRHWCLLYPWHGVCHRQNNPQPLCSQSQSRGLWAIVWSVFLSVVFLSVVFLSLVFLSLVFLSLVFLSLVFLSLVFLSLVFLSLVFLSLVFLSIDFLSLVFLSLVFLSIDFLSLVFLSIDFLSLLFLSLVFLSIDFLFLDFLSLISLVFLSLVFLSLVFLSLVFLSLVFLSLVMLFANRSVTFSIYSLTQWKVFHVWNWAINTLKKNYSWGCRTLFHKVRAWTVLVIPSQAVCWPIPWVAVSAAPPATHPHSRGPPTPTSHFNFLLLAGRWGARPFRRRLTTATASTWPFPFVASPFPSHSEN